MEKTEKSNIVWLRKILSHLKQSNRAKERLELYNGGYGCIYNTDTGNEKKFKNLNDLIRVIRNQKEKSPKTEQKHGVYRDGTTPILRKALKMQAEEMRKPRRTRVSAK